MYREEKITAQAEPLDGYIRIFENFAEHICTGAPLIADLQAGLRQVQLANAIQLLGWKSVPLKVPCDEAEYDAQLQKRIDAEG